MSRIRGIKLQKVSSTLVQNTINWLKHFNTEESTSEQHCHTANSNAISNVSMGNNWNSHKFMSSTFNISLLWLLDLCKRVYHFYRKPANYRISPRSTSRGMWAQVCEVVSNIESKSNCVCVFLSGIPLVQNTIFQHFQYSTVLQFSYNKW